jgi:hypothetical protein
MSQIQQLGYVNLFHHSLSLLQFPKNSNRFVALSIFVVYNTAVIEVDVFDKSDYK